MAVVAHHVLLALSLVALADAALRTASLAAPGGLERLVAAAPLAAGAAVAEALGLGLVGLGADPLALAGAAVLTSLAARRLLPAPERSLVSEAAGWWRGLGRPVRLLAGVLTGIGLAWVAFVLRWPGLGEDAISYQLGEVFAWVQSGRPGSIVPFFYGLPVGNYPLTNEVLTLWGTGIARSPVPAALVVPALMAVGAASSWLALRALRVPTLVAAFAVAALWSTPEVVAQLARPDSDVPALGWLACTAALAIASRERPALLAPALVAAGLAIGTKTTVAPLSALALGYSLYASRAELRGHGRVLLPAAGLALVVGGTWYFRNLVTHGSPLWPFFALPWGDPVPPLIESLSPSFIERPGRTLEGRVDDYAASLAGALVLFVGALLAPIVARRRLIVAATAVTALSILIWANAPVTGRVDTLPGFGGRPVVTVLSLTATRYLLPAIAAAALTLALASRAGRAGRVLALGVAGAALLWNAERLIALDFPERPGLGTLLLGAAAGSLVALFAEAPAKGLAAPARRVPRLAAATLLAVAVLAAGAAMAVAADGYIGRHVLATNLYDRELVGWFEARDGFGSGDEPVAMVPFTTAFLAGERLRHPIELIPAHEGCPDVESRLRRGWVLIADFPEQWFDPPPRALRCLKRDRPTAVVGPWRVYAPRTG